MLQVCNAVAGYFALASMMTLQQKPDPAAVQRYVFTRIARNTPDSGFIMLGEGGAGGPAINSKGVVSFTGSTKDPNTGNSAGNGVFIGDGGAVTMIANNASSHISGSFHDTTCINDQGIVAFQGYYQGRQGVFKGNGDHMEKLEDAASPLSYGPYINAKGVVSFFWNKGGSDDGIYTAENGSITTITEYDGKPPIIVNPTGGDINASGAIVFIGSSFDSVSSIYMTSNGQLVALLKVPASASDPPSPFSRFSVPVINSKGDIAFAAKLSNGGEGVYLLKNGNLIVVADTRQSFTAFDGSYLNAIFATAINDRGQVVFGALTKPNEFGIFTGPDPVANKVIGSGDTLDGSTVRALSFWQHGLNNKGQITFYATLADGTRGVYRADPVH